MQVIALRRGGAKCSSACPFYEEKGWVRGFYGVPLKTHCRMTMNEWMVDCDVYNPLCIDKMDVTEAQWERMQRTIGQKAVRVRKEYPDEHEEIHGVGCEWTRGKGRYNADKSGTVTKKGLYPCRIKN